MFASARSFWLNVFRAASTTTRKRRKPASAGVTRNVTSVVPASSSTRSMPTCSPFANSRTVAGWAVVERTCALTSISSPSRDVDGAVIRSMRTSSVAPSPIDFVSTWTPRAAASAASAWPWPGRVVAVRQQHDPLLGVVREQRRCEAKRRADVRRRGHRRGGDTVDVAELGGQSLHQRALAERDDAGHVAFRHQLEAVADEREGVLASAFADAVREVDDEHRREAIDRQHEPEAGQREHERRQQQRPDEEREAAPADPGSSSSAEMESDRQRQRRDEQQQPERRVERDPHQALRPAGPRNRDPSERQPRTTTSRW